ncbi:MAG TPA: YggS family pyridoxal phosphate-dependent enzyme [Vicinamibacterales bacterium]|nr:YggS family pyridoxal phosphate-dependent enzyme [Vicinamibacterales bacterium]
MDFETSIAANLTAVRGRLDAAARAAGRDPASVRLIAVSKTFSLDYVRAAAAAGQQDFGENRVQEALQKVEASTELKIRWHLIGHLQTNKARKAVGPFACIHSVDSLELLRRLEDAAAAQGAHPDILVQVDLAGEATKFGAPPEEVRQIVREAARCRALRLVGLMLMPPFLDDPEQVRPYFARLRGFRDELARGDAGAASLHELSMGMSHDFEVAVQEGATMVRIGTAIFGRRSQHV